jgi:glutamate-1-semialdehyde aminotransferase
MAAWISRIDGLQVAACYRGRQIDGPRVSIGGANEILQSSAKRLPAGLSFRAHAHLSTRRETVGTQEAWVVVSGLVRARVFDVDDSIMVDLLLGPGDCLVSFRGGHSLTVVEEALLYEFKNGPYFGQEEDKRWIEDGPKETGR